MSRLSTAVHSSVNTGCSTWRNEYVPKIQAVTTADVVRAGANVLVAGSAVFKGGNYKANIATIRQAAALARGEAA